MALFLRFSSFSVINYCCGVWVLTTVDRGGGLKPPGELSFDGNLSDGWRIWRRQLENYWIAIDLNQPNGRNATATALINRRQVAILLNCARDEANEIYSQFNFDDDGDNKKLSKVLEKFEAYCNPRKNRPFEWYIFWSLEQGKQV